MTIKEYVQLQKDLIRDEVSKLSVKPTIAIIQAVSYTHLTLPTTERV